ncbi:putative delta-60 repeat protein [Motilibacter peucedani]|uniref:Putative delta-60 repeat protein n=1 Tax=Motilibacter peucedani TaxID=598650 RepID=A0A420XRI9_9ACTN|nr:hypothetical protein [Motilibacter peucedani]RKS77462.1 putative delta-60 repeat protein [Motilibacter peucedani]
MNIRHRVLLALAAAILGLTTAAPAGAATNELDTAWAHGGKLFGLGAVQLVDSHGRAVLARVLPDGAMRVTRLTFAGAPDPSFGTSGSVTLPLRSFVPPPGEGGGLPEVDALYPAGVSELPDGRLVVLGTSGNNVGFELVRLRPNGSTDPTFVGVGYNPVGEYVDNGGASALVTYPDGSALVAVNRFADQHWLQRFAPDGTLDTRPGSRIDVPNRPLCSVDGTPPLPRCYDGWSADINHLLLRPDGRIVVVLSNSDATMHSFVAQFLPSGALDTSFGPGGVAELPLGHAYGAVLSPSGDLFLSGVPSFPTPATPPAPVRVVDLTGTGRLRAAFGDHGVATAWNGLYRAPDGRRSADGGLALDASGRVVVAGTGLSTVDAGVQYCSVTRFTASGALDRSYSLDHDGTATDGRRNSSRCRGITVDAAGGYLVSAGTDDLPTTSLVERFRP